MTEARFTFGSWLLLLAGGVLLGLILAGVMIDWGASHGLQDAGCVCP